MTIKEIDEWMGQIIWQIWNLLHGPRQVGRQHQLQELSDQLTDLWIKHQILEEEGKE